MFESLNNWIVNSIKTDSWKKYDDLNITKIRDVKIDRDMWLEEGVKYLSVAKSISKKISKINKFEVVLAQSLTSGKGKLGVNFSSVSELNKQMDKTPPSLYIVRKDWNDWVEQIAISSEIKLKGLPIYKVYYLEFKSQNDNEYRRSIWVL